MPDIVVSAIPKALAMHHTQSLQVRLSQTHVRLGHLLNTYLSILPLSQTSSGHCKNCACRKANQRCLNCLSSHLGHCENQLASLVHPGAQISANNNQQMAHSELLLKYLILLCPPFPRLLRCITLRVYKYA